MYDGTISEREWIELGQIELEKPSLDEHCMIKNLLRSNDDQATKSDERMR